MGLALEWIVGHLPLPFAWPPERLPMLPRSQLTRSPSAGLAIAVSMRRPPTMTGSREEWARGGLEGRKAMRHCRVRTCSDAGGAQVKHRRRTSFQGGVWRGQCTSQQGP